MLECVTKWDTRGVGAEVQDVFSVRDGSNGSNGPRVVSYQLDEVSGIDTANGSAKCQKIAQGRRERGLA
jgi:hypothetical protein